MSTTQGSVARSGFRWWRIIVAVLAFTAPTSAALGAEDEKRVIGAVEDVLFVPWGITVRARVDTGAATSSLDARQIQVRGPRGARMVRFTLVDDDGRRRAVEMPVVGHRRVVATEGKPETRPAVQIEVCVAGVRTPIEVTLNDRSSLEHRVLLGRNLLEGRFVVDVARSLTAPPACPAGQ